MLTTYHLIKSWEKTEKKKKTLCFSSWKCQKLEARLEKYKET